MSAVPPAAPSLSQSTLKLLTWTNPVCSAKVFVGIIATLVLFKYVNVPSLLFYLGSIVLGVSALAEFVSKKVTGQGIISKLKPHATTYFGNFVDGYSPRLVKNSKTFELFVQDLVYSVDLETTAKFAGISFVLYKFTSWFSLWSLILTFTLISFTVPAIYLKYKEIIDESAIKYSKLTKDRAAVHYSTLRTKAAPHVAKLDKKLGPVSTFIKSKVPYRTAGSTVGASKAAPVEPVSTATASGVKTSSTTSAPLKTQVAPSSSDFVSQVKSEASSAAAKASANAPISNPLAD